MSEDRTYVRLDVAHGVVNGGESRERAARRVEVDLNIALSVHLLQTQQLSHHSIGDVVRDGGAEEDDAVLEELGVRIDAAHAVRRTLLPLRDVVVHRRGNGLAQSERRTQSSGHLDSLLHWFGA